MSKLELLQQQDKKLTGTERRLRGEWLKAQRACFAVREEYWKLKWGLEIGSKVISIAFNSIHVQKIFTVTRIESEYATTFSKRVMKPWVTGRLDSAIPGSGDIPLFSNWDPHENKPEEKA